MNKDENGNEFPEDVNFFKEFVESLDKVDDLSNEGRDLNREYVEGLINKYGLPDDPEIKEAFIKIRRKMLDTSVELPAALLQYFNVYLKDIRDRGYDTAIMVNTAFCLGIAFLRSLEIEMVPNNAIDEDEIEEEIIEEYLDEMDDEDLDEDGPIQAS
ncbi:MAG: hypothetical protein PHF07_00450 [Candidatus Pacebacteria bacterium]|nr:hypothetical protein [Candidatus Paceibacterota bacterium]